MKLNELKSGDDFTLSATGVQYQYEGKKNHHRTGFMHWAIKDGIKTAFNHKDEVEKV